MQRPSLRFSLEGRPMSSLPIEDDLYEGEDGNDNEVLEVNSNVINKQAAEWLMAKKAKAIEPEPIKKPDIDEKYLNSILNTTSLNDATKAYMIATAQYPADEANAAMRAATLQSPAYLEEGIAGEAFKLKVKAEG